MFRFQTHKWWLFWLVVAAIGGGGIVAAQYWLRPLRILAERIERELDELPPADVNTRLRQLAAFGEDGIPSLARAMRHPRREVAEGARGVLSEELDRWQLIAPAEASRRLATLARELARDIEQAPPEFRAGASDLATRILLWPVDARAVDQAQLVADCEQVLLAAELPRERESPRMVQQAGAAFVPRWPSAENNDPPLSPLDQALAIPGGDLPVEMTSVPTLPPAERAQPQVLPPGEDPQLAPIVEHGEEPRRFFPDASAPRASNDAPSPTLTSIYQLVSSVAEERDAAEAALRSQGFGEAHLAVARRFADPRPAVRRQLAEHLAHQTVVDARPWLLRLLGDEDRDVRLTTAKILSTSSDPQMLHKLREQLLGESDPDVRAALSKAVGP
jgi:hypothetical protein